MENRENALRAVCDSIPPVDADVVAAARARLDSLVKPPGSLGRLEDIAAELAGMTGKIKNRIHGKCVVIMSSDNGIVEEGVASAPQSVTAMQTLNFLRGITGVAVLARCTGTELMVVDVGVNGDVARTGVIDRKIRPGTSNFCHGPAMTREEALQALLTGVEMARDAHARGFDLLGAGEMGIGNTTTASSVLCVLTGCGIDLATGRGAGLSDEAYARKKQVIREGIEHNRPNPDDAVDVLGKVGGFDIAAMAGLYLGAASLRIPIVVDGFISAAAALAAYRICPAVRGFMLPSHASAEPGYALLMEALGMKPLLALGMRLGEGSGCPLAFGLVEAACAVMNDMATFEEASINADYLDRIDEAERFRT